MNLRYGEEKYFIGIVKFFDSRKGFGYLASNSCGMNVFPYDQDFYINTDSFAEHNAAREGAIVVFQVEVQGVGKTRAVNVRYFNKTEDDFKLALTYYGNYEKVRYKERYINLYNQLSKPRSMELEVVRKKIVMDGKTASDTLEIFSFYISHFKEKKEANERYIFDRDFLRVEKDSWCKFFSELLDEEKKLILKSYPSSYKYFETDNLFEVLSYYVEHNSKELKELLYINGLIEGMESDLKDSIQQLLMQKAESLTTVKIDELKRDKSIWKTIEEVKEDHFFSSAAHFSGKSVDEIWVEKQLEPYKILSSKSFDSDIIELVRLIRFNKYEALNVEYQSASNVEMLENLLQSFDALYETDKEKAKPIIKEIILSKLKHDIDQGRLSEIPDIIHLCEGLSDDFTKDLKIVSSPLLRKYFCEWREFNEESRLKYFFEQLKKNSVLIEQDDMDVICEYTVNQISKSMHIQSISIFVNHVYIFGSSFNAQLKEKLSESLCDKLADLVDKSLVSKYEFSRFFSVFESYSPILNESDKMMVIDYTRSVALSSKFEIQSELLKHESFLSGSSDEFLEKYIEGVKSYINNWTYIKFANFFYQPDEAISRFSTLKEYVAKKGIDIISNYRLKENFENDSDSSSSSVDVYNCIYLKNLVDFIGKDKPFKPWVNYIASRTTDELLILFDNDVINQLPSSINDSIINKISLNDVEAPVSRWYHKPNLKNNLYIKALSSYSDLFSIIEKRIIQIPFVPDNIPLVILLVELLSLNKPKEEDAQWNADFITKIVNLSNRHSDNRLLQVALWSVYLKTYNKDLPISDIFPYLPPYLQIKIVKWFFYVKANNKINFTAHSLHRYIGGNNKNICFAVAIALEYLKLREDDPTASLTHNVMLRLMQDREDHSEWVGIRHFVHDCKGRYVRRYKDNQYSSDSWGVTQRRWRFYNGIAFNNKDGSITVFVPRNMVNEHGEQQNYNNKLFNDICQYVRIAFKDVKEIQGNNNYNGTFFTINKKYELDIRSLVRIYNLRYEELHDEIINIEHDNKDSEVKNFCECRLADKADSSGFTFYWCDNRPCFRDPVRFHLSSEWKDYTILDFLRILDIPIDYINKQGKVTHFGYYIILSSYLLSFAKFYEHLKCRRCGKLMKPLDVSNFASRAVTEFTCHNEHCEGYMDVVYLNHCFNRNRCNATIDSRDSKKCPNGQYICPDCGACCSTQNFANRIGNLRYNGGYVSPWLENFVSNNLGHWEKSIIFCYKCGVQLQNGQCPICGLRYKK